MPQQEDTEENASSPEAEHSASEHVCLWQLPALPSRHPLPSQKVCLGAASRASSAVLFLHGAQHCWPLPRNLRAPLVRAVGASGSAVLHSDLQQKGADVTLSCLATNPSRVCTAAASVPSQSQVRTPACALPCQCKRQSSL